MACKRESLGRLDAELKILLVTNKCPPDFDGGYELRAFQIAGALRMRGCEVAVVTSRFRRGFVATAPDPDWVHRIFHYVPTSELSGIVRKLDAAKLRIESTSVGKNNVPALASFLEGKQYDVAYCFGLHRIGLSVATVLSSAKIPILWHLGGTFLVDQLIRWPRSVFGFETSLQLLARRWRGLEKTIDLTNAAFVSQFLRDEFHTAGMRFSNEWIIPRGIDFPVASDVSRKRAVPPVLMMAGRVDSEKGIDTAVQAAGLLHKRRPELDWLLSVVGRPGDPSYMRSLARRISNLGIERRVRFEGHVPHEEVLRRMHEATVFVSCSRYGEPFANTIIESMACGTPLVGSKDGSIEEVVEDGKSALLFDRNDSGKLVDHLEAILTDEQLRTTIAANACEVIRGQYTLDAVLDLTEEALRRVADQRRTSGN